MRGGWVAGLALVALFGVQRPAFALSAPFGLVATPVSSTAIDLAWQDGVGSESGFEVERSTNGTSYSLIGSTTANIRTYRSTGLTSGTTYWYRVRAKGSGNNRSDYSNVVSAQTVAVDTTAPPTPAGLTATVASCSQVNLAWGAVSDSGGSGLRGYNLYRNGTFFRQVLTPATTTIDSGRTGSTSYSYQVAAVDNAGNTSAVSAVVQVTTPSCSTTTTTVTTSTTSTTLAGDGIAPSIPTGISATAAGCSQVNVAWTASSDTGGSGLRSYYVYRNGVFFREVLAPATSTADTGRAASTAYAYRVAARDNAGNLSALSVQANVTTPSCATTSTVTATTSTTSTTVADSQDPTVPQNPFASPASCSQINVSWSASTDAGGSGLRGYNVYRNNVLAALVLAPGSAWSDTGRAASTIYSYRVAAIDNAGNESNQSSIASANTPACPTSGTGQYRWSGVWGGTDHDIGRAVAVGSDGSVVMTGTLKATANFGGGNLTAVGSTDVYVAKYTVNGAHVWSRRMGGVGTDAPAGVAVDGSGNVIVVGKFGSSVDFGGGPLTAAGMDDIFVAKYAGTNGAHLWSRRFGGVSPDGANAVDVDGSGNVVVVGVFGGTVGFGGANLTSVGPYDAFVLKLNTSGTHVWSFRLGDVDYENAWGVSCDPSDNVVVVGNFSTTLNPGTGALTSAGETDVYVAKYSSAGASVWGRRYGSTGPDTGFAVATDASGNVGIGGNFSGTVNFGGSNLTAVSANDMFVAKLTSAGNHVWSRSSGGTYTDAARGVAFDGAGNLVATGNFAGSANFGGGAFSTPNSSDDVFVAKYSPTGGHVWSKRYGDVITDMGQGIAVDTAGNTLVAGYFQISIDLGGGRVWGPGNTDAFLLSLAP